MGSYEKARQQMIDSADDGFVCISAVGEALIALEKEISDLEHEAAMLHRKLANITCKQRICTSTIKKILENARLKL